MNNLQELAFPIHEMLGLPESVALRVERVSGPTTALTLRVEGLRRARHQLFYQNT